MFLEINNRLRVLCLAGRRNGILLFLLCLCTPGYSSQVYADAGAEAQKLKLVKSETPASGCVQCHSDENPVDLQKGISDKLKQKCVQCHTMGAPGGGVPGGIQGISGGSESGSESESGAFLSSTINSVVGSVVAAEIQDAPAKQPVNRPPGNNLALAPGMRYPMYNLTTRLGDKPNEMILIPAGEFTMGSNSRLPDEGPMHKVTLPAYYIDLYEVTNMQYKSFIDATQRRSPRYFRNRTFPQGKADHPVTYVNWKDADAYCQWAGKRLPNEHEWEKAARGTDARTYPWGNDFEIHFANTPGRWKELGVFGETTPVGSFEKGVSPYGVHDMSGNVWEWTASWYKSHPGNKMPSESYGERYKTLKGGSWWDCSFYKCGLSAPVYNRSFFAKSVKNDSFGFRCAKDQASAIRGKK